MCYLDKRVIDPKVDVYKVLSRYGIRDYDIMRALKLAKKAVIQLLDEEKIIVIVPSQRLHEIPREHYASILDLKEFLEGKHKVKAVKVGRLPADQQWYHIIVHGNNMTCNCPDTIYNHNPACIHKIAAIVALYVNGYQDLALKLLKKLSSSYLKRHSLILARN